MADARFCLDPTTPVCDRVNGMNAAADAAASDPAVRAAAQRVRDRVALLLPTAPVPGASERLLALEALRLVHGLPYVAEKSGLDCYQPPGYTLAHGGECKALSTLYVALARLLGLRAEVLWIDQEGAPLNHVVAVVFVAGQPTWAECSVSGAMLGESPYEAIERLGAHHVVGGQKRPAGQLPVVTGLPSPQFYPFPWAGWTTLWRGFPAAWWLRYYPWLYGRSLPVPAYLPGLQYNTPPVLPYGGYGPRGPGGP